MYTSPYIGRTALVDAVLRSKIPLLLSGELTDPIERRLIFTGPPGVAKTDLARALSLEIAGQPLHPLGPHRLAAPRKTGHARQPQEPPR